MQTLESPTGQADVAIALGGANMSKQAGGGLCEIDGSPSVPMIRAIILRISQTKSGGYVFTRSKLWDAARAEVRSRLGLDKFARVPEAVDKVIGEEAARAASSWADDARKRGFTERRVGAEKTGIASNAGVKSVVTSYLVRWQRDHTLREQATLARQELMAVRRELTFHEAGKDKSGKPYVKSDELIAKRGEGLTKREARWAGMLSEVEERIANAVALVG
jgi:hypothetical protein